ncbi:MAG: hypothetical protein KZQ64_06500 [gamma proteobacterium symbiont of Bathyaustriella thionipta]|nr:hypothetical protein [gamma proteobacterium symbiont of Bathyaustriella thionipta]MCU7950547.1 hypothetical protein [gamma proteobacterium symbiont of Bathyaustriella thionipta]MCU7953022.1 hypothetical protein [gamma proteobacterium symbiont of Bathyaustriella thionipta]MCU7957055.1 hypothetical protein [gamma proteobacterium symbiont of Bathyaustriella thionipta]MCU7966725.1 hypothetical protein [gamma proteobacterium symbiont of Bathyaustriella thionipta]
MFFCDFDHKPALEPLLARYFLQLNWVKDNATIPGTWFGEPEAGIIKNQLYVRQDTPIHSALHESCHYICMDAVRRSALDTDAAGGYDEENGVCYLQILLADYLPDMGQKAMMADMDEWGYTFRLGSAKRWFEEDAEDARQWLLKHCLINNDNTPTWKLRQ